MYQLHAHVFIYRNGVDRSGLFCVVTAVIERLRVEQDVAITQVIEQMRCARDQIVPSVVSMNNVNNYFLQVLIFTILTSWNYLQS